MTPTEADREILERIRARAARGPLSHEVVHSAMMECSSEGKAWLALEIQRLQSTSASS